MHTGNTATGKKRKTQRKSKLQLSRAASADSIDEISENITDLFENELEDIPNWKDLNRTNLLLKENLTALSVALVIITL